MQNNLLKRAFNSLRQQPFVSAISLIGSALAIFLIMIVVMIEQLPFTDIRPELNKDRFLTQSYTSIKNKNWDGTSNGQVGFNTVRETFYKMTTPEEVTAFTGGWDVVPMAQPKGTPISVRSSGTDDRFFRVFNFEFIDGAPFTKEQFESSVPVAVISESIAKQVFGSTAVTGREFELAHVPYRVAGVVRDVPSISRYTYSDVWVPLTTTNAATDTWNDYMGGLSAVILAKSKDDFPVIREEYDRIFAEFNEQISETGWEIITLGRPYDIEEEIAAPWANMAPRVKEERRRRLVTFAILLLVPAVNLSSMTHSRLSRRAKEIGVRRAFGATRTEIMGDLFMENLVITIFAGLIGWVLSVVFALLFRNYIFSATWGASGVVGLDVTDLIRWSTFGWAMLFCFLLNLLSAGLPAWQASRTNIVNAISGKN